MTYSRLLAVCHVGVGISSHRLYEALVPLFRIDRKYGIYNIGMSSHLSFSVTEILGYSNHRGTDLYWTTVISCLESISLGTEIYL